MENVIKVAEYIAGRYFQENGQIIDEMKLHKMLYFAQRESLVQTGEPLFSATFYGWKFGPVLKEIRNAYKRIASLNVPSELQEENRSVMEHVFREYAQKNSWSLSRLTHGELSWQNSRIGIPEDINGDNPMSLEDIRKDAARIKTRREKLQQLGLA